MVQHRDRRARPTGWLEIFDAGATINTNRMESPSRSTPLYVYMIGVAVAWAIILGGIWFWDVARFHTFAILCAGFFIGMLAMYIAVHLCKWR